MKPHFLFRRTFRRAVALAGPCLGALTASAQIAAPADGSGTAAGGEDTINLPAFVVSSEHDRGYYAANAITGTRTNTALIDLPLSMQVLNREFINDIAARDLVDIAVYSSGVVQGAGQDSFVGDNTNFTMRGMQGGLPLRNGFRRLRMAPAGNIERVEILRGPNSLLYGQIEPGGVINYVTKRPTKQASSSVNLQFGSYEFYRAEIDVNQPLIPNKLGFRLLGSYQDSQSWIDYLHNRTQLINPVLTWWIDPKTQWTVEYEGSARRVDGFRGVLPYPASNPSLDIRTLPWADNVGIHFNLYGPGTYNDEIFDVFTTEFLHTFNDNFSLRLAAAQSHRWSYTDRTGANGISGPSYSMIARTSNYSAPAGIEKWLQADLDNTFRLAGVEVKNLFGYEYKQDDWYQVKQGNNDPTKQPPNWDLNDPSTWNTWTAVWPYDFRPSLNSGSNSLLNTQAYYFTNQLTMWDDHIHTLVGMRWDQVKQRGYDGISKSKSAIGLHDSTPQAGVIYKPIHRLSFYGLYSEAFYPLYLSQQRNSKGEYYIPKPVAGKGWDIGVKSELYDGKLAGTMTVFELEKEGILRSVIAIDPTDGTQYVAYDQSGVERSTGFEASLMAVPREKLQVLLNYAYTDAYVKTDPQNPARVGLPLEQAPKHIFSFMLKQNFGEILRARDVSVTFGGRYNSVRYSESVPNALAMEAYWVFEAGVGCNVKIGRVTYHPQLNVRNLFDNFYRADRWSWGAPREFTLSIGARF
ncbi:MAG TPA: TonB-dependent receptor plug domain-containing protein [Opitutaceae bacterium]|nr:TonB-dependent receptor plug domain-containing protein [Opitutaceae bacterium]